MKIRLDIRLAKAVVCLLAGLALFLAGMLAFRVWGEGTPRSASPDTGAGAAERPDNGVYYNGCRYVPRDDVETMLLLGIDKYTEGSARQDVHGEYEQSDFLLLLVADRKAGRCTAVQINRDTMAEIQILSDAGARLGMAMGQITLAHTYGGDSKMRCRNTAKAVSDLFYGIKIDHYLSLAMDGIAVLNDLAGGVTVTVLDDFGGADDGLVQGETVTLRGEQALTYVRTRKGLEDSSNLHRMERQRQYLDALQKKLLEKTGTSENFIHSALFEVNEYMVSDCTVNQLSEFAEMLREYGVSDYRTLEGEAAEGEEHIEYYVDEDALRALIMELFYEPQDGPAQAGDRP